MPEAYHYVFAPLVNVHLLNDALDVGSFRVHSIQGEVLREFARSISEKFFIEGVDFLCNALEEVDEAAFVVKPLRIETIEKPQPDIDITIIEYVPPSHDAFLKERRCFNLIFQEPVFTPVVLCADDFPTARRLGSFWSSHMREWWFNADEKQVLQESQVGIIQKLMGFQIGERLDGREWLSRALLEYESGSQSERKANDSLLDYFSGLEALYGASEGGEITEKLTTRVATVLARTDEEYGKLRDRIRKFYRVRSRKLHGDAVQPLQEAELMELRTYLRRAILVGFELSRGTSGPRVWKKICEELLNPRNKELLRKLESIRDSLSAIW